MPVDYQQIREQVQKLGEKAPQRLAEQKAKLDQAKGLLSSHHANLTEINKRVELAASKSQDFRCAFPVGEDLEFKRSLPEGVPDATILAADGSQLTPSHHDAADFGLVNLGAICYAKKRIPKETTQSQLLYDEQLETSTGTLSEEMISLLRDVAERQLLAELASGEPFPVVALTDGILEIYGEPRKDIEFQKQFNIYLASLRKLADLRVGVAGYVDKPRADFIVRMLELMIGDEESLEQRIRERPLRGITDASLMIDRLAPGERSAVFGIQSRSSKDFSGEIALHFFYLNVGDHSQTALARVEIPRWVLDSSALLDLIHGVIYSQCRIVGSKPYPYVLHRAHEIAVVGLAEKEQITNLINTELMKHGINPGEKSQKQGLKDLEGRKWKEK